MATGLYIHVPFCKRKCPYCDFYSLSFCKESEEKYTDAVVRNLLKYKGEKIDTVYFGGGTPSLLSYHSFNTIFKAISENMLLDTDAEITLEANPCSVDKEKLTLLKNIGFNRISFGVQSCIDSELKALGRLHNYETARKAVLDAYSAGFENISCDLMLGLIGQSSESLAISIERLCKLPINHISAYMLKIENGTPYDCNTIKDRLPDEDTVCNLYELTQERLCEKGFCQYEISNFARKGYESRHNLKYWRCEEYIGIGPSAHSFYNGKRFYCPPSLDDFISSELQKSIITEPHPHSFEEYAMLKLRLSEGLTFKEIDSFNIDRAELLKKAEPLKKALLIDIDNKRIRITQKGFLVSNKIIVELIM